jgi:putative oxidoreductase
MFSYLRKPHPDLASLVLRLGLAAVFIMHGYLLISQDFAVTDRMSLQTQKLVGWSEFVCGILLAMGLLSRLAALGVIALMIGAIAVVTGPRGFVDIRLTAQGYNFEAGGFEYNFVLIVASLAVLLLGSGRASVDQFIFGRKRGQADTVAVPREQTSAGAPALRR